MQFDEVLDDGQAQTGASRPGARLVHAIEALEHAPQVGLGHPWTEIADRQQCAISIGPRFQFDVPSVGG